MPPEFFQNESELPHDVSKIDSFLSSMRELYFIENPQIDKRIHDAGSIKLPTNESSQWVYYAEHNTAVRIPSEEIYFKLRTARNRNLITATEQLAYRNSIVGIAGLSVGSQVLSALVQSGGSKKIKIADPDTIEISNLNRMRATLRDVGAYKTRVAARNVWDLDPFAQVESFHSGLTEITFQTFILEPRLTVFIDEMDAISLKIKAREACKAAHIPVLMATDNGDSVILDVERFDQEPDRPLFHGRVDEKLLSSKETDRAHFVALANEIIDPKMFTERQWCSIQQIGSTLSGVPQIATAAMIAGAAVAYAVRLITTGADLPSGRYVMGCENSIAEI